MNPPQKDMKMIIWFRETCSDEYDLGTWESHQYRKKLIENTRGIPCEKISLV